VNSDNTSEQLINDYNENFNLNLKLNQSSKLDAYPSFGIPKTHYATQHITDNVTFIGNFQFQSTEDFEKAHQDVKRAAFNSNFSNISRDSLQYVEELEMLMCHKSNKINDEIGTKSFFLL